MNASHEQRWGIVGGGVLGLTLAWRLAQRGQRVVVYEASDHVGGLASAWNLGDVVWDRHYHVTLLSDSYTRGLLAELGLEQEMRWVETKTGFYTDGRLHSLSNSWEFLRFPPLSLWDKLRLAATIAYAARITDWRRLESISVADWLRRLSGRRTFEKIWLPLLRSKLGENYRRTSAAFIWATISRMYAARRTGLKKEMFGYVPGGYARILARLSEKLTAAGVELETGRPVRRVDSADQRPTIHFADDRSEVFDRVVLTTPAPIAAQIGGDLSPDERSRLGDIEYQGILCGSLLLRKPLADYYVTNITDAAPFTAVIEMSALVDPAEFGGRSLVYLPKYLAADDPLWRQGDGEIEELFIGALARMYPKFRREDVECFRLSRVRHVHALATLNYSAGLPGVETSAPGVTIVSSFQIVNGTLNVNETIRLAEEAVPRLLALAKTAHSQPCEATR